VVDFRQESVPEILLSTVDFPNDLGFVGCIELIQARVVRTRSSSSSEESQAKELSSVRSD